jgi:Uma2 family endonuclease
VTAGNRDQYRVATRRTAQSDPARLRHLEVAFDGILDCGSPHCEPVKETLMSVAQRVSEAEYERIVLAEPDENWELHDGRLVEKPPMTWNHDEVAIELAYHLRSQLDRRQYRVRVEGRVRRSPGTIFRPDVSVVPTPYGAEFRDRDNRLAIFSGPLPLVVEIWSPSTGNYDVDAKLSIYRQRGDFEIWRIHPFERTLTAWRRNTDGSYAESIFRDGVVEPVALPGVAIDLQALFDV